MDINYKTLSRLIDGYYNIHIGKYKLKVVPTSIDIENKAEKYYEHIIDELKYDNNEDWLAEDRRLFILQYHNIWLPEQEKQIEQSFKDIDKLKVQLYYNFHLVDTKKLIKDKLTQIQNEINSLHYQKYTFYEFTKESYASMLKNRYIIENTVYYKDDLFFKIKKRNRLYYFNRINSLMEDLSVKNIRDLVNTEEWKNLWGAANTQVFDKPILKCNKEQKMAISVSQMLDNIRQHPKCPDEDIIKDSDALDGWIIHQNEEQKKEKRKQDIENSIKDKNAGEVFIMANSPEEIKSVMSLNDPQTNKDIREMQKYVKTQNKDIAWQEVPSMRQRILREHKSD